MGKKSKAQLLNELQTMPTDELIDDICAASFDCAVCVIAISMMSESDVTELFADGQKYNLEAVIKRLDGNMASAEVIKGELIRRIGDDTCLNFSTPPGVM